ncbi:MAG: hypothetical protein IJH65_07425 [Methanobrevibacter sp.]|nr:hypothetical protein [Clostridia bacterium]MBQ6628637.1 hypothetical protein [Methanobrevibacter sp.]
MENWINNKKFVLTGSTDETKERYEQIISENGGTVYGRVSDKVDYVIWNPYFEHETVKLKTAQEYNGMGKNIVIYTEQEFEDLLEGKEVHPATEQVKNTHEYVPEFSAELEPEKVEEYIASHDIDEINSQRYLHDLLEAYWKRSVRAPLQWCEKIAADGKTYSVENRLFAAEYFSHIGQYDRADELLDSLMKDLYSGEIANVSWQYKNYAAKQIQKLLDKNQYYRNGNPYWPFRKERKIEISEFYDELGIAHKNPYPEKERKLHGHGKYSLDYDDRQQKKAREVGENYKGVDYQTNTDKKYNHFVSDTGLRIGGLSDVTINKFFDLGWISNFGDVFRLWQHKDEMLELTGFKEKSVNNILEGIEKARNVDDIDFISCLSIPNIGQAAARKILDVYGMESAFEIARTIDDYAYFCDIEGIGPDTSGSFVAWCKDENNYEVYEDLLSEITLVEKSKAETGKKCEGLTFVCTGSLNTYKNRKELFDYIESEGGTVSDKINSATSFLINNDMNSPSSKNKKAKSLRIEIISEDDFNSRFK